MHLRLLFNCSIVGNMRHLVIRVACGRLSRVCWPIGESCIGSILGVWSVTASQSVTFHRDNWGGGSWLEIGVGRVWIIQGILFGRWERPVALRDELSDVLARRRTSQQGLRKYFGDLAVGHERMHHDLVQGGPSCRITRKNTGDQIPSLRRDLDMVWERVLVSFDSSVRCFHIGCLEWRLANYQCVNDDT